MKMSDITMIKREPFMDTKELAKHLRTIGQAIIDDAEKFALDARNVRIINIEAEIAPNEQITSIHYEINRYADPRRRVKKDESKEKKPSAD